MSEATLIAEAPRRRIGAPPGHGRFPPVPPPPRWVRSEWEILDEQTGALGLTLWQALRDVLLWNDTDPQERRGLFRPLHAAQQDLLARAIAAAPELADALRDLAQLSAVPESADAARVAAACEAVWMWAEERGMRGTALQFAEAAAKLEPKSSSRSFSAGRLCRRAADYERSVIWFRRAERLAKRASPPSNIDFANAHLGWGVLEQNRGKATLAEKHYCRAGRAALRSGRRSLAAASHHNLLMLYIDVDKLSKAAEHAEHAIDLYPVKHPRIPFLAFDIGHLWLRFGHFSSSMYLFTNALPWIEGDPMNGLAYLARAAAAVRDKVRYERLVGRLLQMTTPEDSRTPATLYHLAEGARSFEQWERAEELALRATEYARARGDQSILDLANCLLQKLSVREAGDLDVVPDEGGAVDRVTSKVLRKLRKATVPGTIDPRTVLFPERYPTG